MSENGTAKHLEDLERVVTNRLVFNSLIRDRSTSLGMQFNGERDIYKAAGYPDEVNYDSYLRKFLRQDIAKRVIKAAPDSTWRHHPRLMDGEDEDARNDTPFVDAWNEVTSIESGFTELVDSKTIWHYLRRVDVLSGLGKYAVLLVGLRDGKELSEPLERNSVPLGRDGFLYLTPYAEPDATVVNKVEDRDSRRFGLPEMYKIKRVGLVHWSRIIHVAEELLTDEIEGVPRAQAVYNRLEDLEKVLPAAAEAAWKLLYKGMVITTKDGYQNLGGVDLDEVEEYVHGLTRVLELEGVDVNFEGGEVVDPSALVEVLVTFISIASGIPKRILMGSERGELASNQDEANWAARIEERQSTYAEPIILRPLINRFVFSGVMPPPTSGRYSFEWESLFSMDDLEHAQVMDQRASALQRLEQVARIADVDELRERILEWPAREVSANSSFLANQREESSRHARIADATATRAGDDIRSIYAAWFENLTATLENTEDSDREEVIAGALLILRGRVEALMTRTSHELSALIGGDTPELLEISRVLNESFDIFSDRTLENIRQDLESGNLDSASARRRDASLLGGILWTAYQASKFARSGPNVLVRWQGPNDDGTCEPCRTQIAAGIRPLSQTPFPGPDVCLGLTQCRHEVVEVR